MTPREWCLHLQRVLRQERMEARTWMRLARYAPNPETAELCRMMARHEYNEIRMIRRMLQMYCTSTDWEY